MRLGHLSFLVEYFEESVQFYTAIAPYIGLTLTKKTDSQARYGQKDRTRLYFSESKTPTNPIHICFEVDEQDEVDAWYHVAIESGGTDNGPPGVRTHYSPTYYAAFVLDPNGNNIEVVCR